MCHQKIFNKTALIQIIERIFAIQIIQRTVVNAARGDTFGLVII